MMNIDWWFAYICIYTDGQAFIKLYIYIIYTYILVLPQSSSLLLKREQNLREILGSIQKMSVYCIATDIPNKVVLWG